MADQASQNVAQLTVLSILGLTCASGAFGGMLDVIQLLDVRKIIEQEGAFSVTKKRFLTALLLGAIGGVGGAGAMLLILTATAKLSASTEAVNQIYLMSLAMVSGYLGYRVLRNVAIRVEKQILEEAERTEQRIVETGKKFEMEAHYYDAVNMGLIVAEADDALPSEIYEAIARLDKARTQEPDSRELTIILARIYAKLSDYTKAITILSEFLKLIDGTDRQKDRADVLFNRACYYNIMADKLGEQDPQRRELKERVYADLESSFRLSPENKTDATVDPDLASLRTEERFLRFTAS